MATISKRGDSYRVQIRVQGHPPISQTFRSKTAAKRWAQKQEAAIRDGEVLDPKAQRTTLAELVQQYKLKVLPGRKDEQKRGAQLQWWVDRIGGKKLAHITPETVAQARDFLRWGLEPAQLAKLDTLPKEVRSAATVQRYLMALSHAFNVAIKRWHWNIANPVAKVEKPSADNRRVRYLSDEERRALLKACKASPDKLLYPFVRLALATGARAGELCGLHWSQVDVKRQRILLEETKNGDRRALHLSGPALEAIQELRNGKVRAIGDGLVFPAHHDAAKPYQYRYPFEAAVEAAGITDFRFHDLRHSFASYLAMAGASLVDLQEALGHRTLQMVSRYAHLAEAHTASVVARMVEERMAND